MYDIPSDRLLTNSTDYYAYTNIYLKGGKNPRTMIMKPMSSTNILPETQDTPVQIFAIMFRLTLENDPSLQSKDYIELYYQVSQQGMGIDRTFNNFGHIMLIPSPLRPGSTPTFNFQLSGR
ncbi:hypothetical protein [Xenorhabdus cabanillasii]|uniref:Uncharacterized protein n=1 Tax=Xenorhabdus cabanillasii JM26 TaxID=1427517 RepID=W1IME5_9GAMM|nr:hypothetical protein [Xenorhabdus cabanillasii]PHM77454.1 hypothetical protein Xcab_02026 [Xenorhabdus cabanillasii JM26]CDL79672.1 hypothetical protein XCR1_1200027 [Xenorhabdus cabanillasii JM26]